MRLILMDFSGHTEMMTEEHPGRGERTAATIEEIIAETERRMNQGYRALVEETPRGETRYVESPGELRDLESTATVFLVRPLAGG